MSTISAFQTNAFQGGAFQIAASEGRIHHATGIGAVADFRGEERNRKAQDARERAARDALTRTIDAAFEDKPPHPVADDRPEIEEPSIPDYSLIHEALLKSRANHLRNQHAKARKARHDRDSLQLLLMVT